MDALNDVAPAFVEMAHRIVWTVAATTDEDGNAATRVLHPLWQWDGEQLQGWILTSPRSPKAAHLGRRPFISLTYWTSNQDTCTADCATQWEESSDERRAGWDRFANGPDPVAYDPSIIPGWDSPESPSFGVLALIPARLRVMPGTVMTAGTGDVLIWHR